MPYRPAKIISAITPAAFVEVSISERVCGARLRPGASSWGTDQRDQLPVATVGKDLKIIFTQYLNQDSNGTWRANAKLIVAAGQDPATYNRIAAQFNKNPYTNPNIIMPTLAFGSQEWGKCVLNIVVPGVFTGGVEGWVTAWLAKGKYAQVASWLIRVLGPRVALGAGVGLVGALAGGVAWCSTPWAS